MTAIETSGVTLASTDPITPPQTKPVKEAAIKKAAARDGSPDASLTDAPVPPAPPAVMDARSTSIAAPVAAKVEEGERNSVFAHLVKSDADVVGLVAYSIYKQNKHDWLVALRRRHGREPSDVELAAYVIGEGTARRLATYRHLAEATIEGRGPEVTFAPGGDAGPRAPLRSSRKSQAGLPVWAFAALAAVALVLILMAARFGIPGITPAG